MTLTLTPKKLLISSLSIVAALLISFLAGRYSKPAEIKTQVVEKEVIKWQTKVVYKKASETERHKKTTTTTTEKPDGTKTTTTTTTDDSDKKTTVSDKTDSSGATESDKKTTTEIKNSKPDWRISVKAGYNLGDFKLQYGLTPRLYGVEVDRRIVGTLWLGAWGMTNKTAGLSLGLEF